jgi:hypothetical protein
LVLKFGIYNLFVCEFRRFTYCRQHVEGQKN